jgi:hemoglobin
MPVTPANESPRTLMLIGACAAMILSLGPGCAATPVVPGAFAAPAQPGATLFDRLGGKPAITALVDETVRRATLDPRIRARFVNIDVAHMRAEYIDFICAAAGGPCRYLGKDMKTAHAGMKITAEEFDALLADTRDALDQLRVPAREQGELLALLEPTRRDMVDVPSGAATPWAGGAASAGPVMERAAGFREAATLLEKAEGERSRGHRSLAEQLFSFAELVVGPDAVAALAPLFRQGAPRRITTPTRKAASRTPQPVAVGNSDLDEAARPARGALTGVVKLPAADFDAVAVVTLEPASGQFRRPRPQQRVVEQRNRQFAPRVLVVPVGSTVSFPNFDSVYHNVFSRSEANSFDLGLYRSGEERQIELDHEGVVRLACNLHANMSAYVAVVSAPRYLVTDEHGRFAFKNLEPGNYKLRVYSDRFDEPTTQSITIAPDMNSATVVLGGRPRAVVSLDKFGAPREQKPPK